MRVIGIWFYLTCKRFLKRFSFLVILLMLPIAAWLIHTMEQREETAIKIAVYVEDAANNDLGSQMLTSLIESDGQDTMFSFYACADEQQLKDDVASRRAECGYVITEGLREKLDNKKFKRSIEVYSAPSTVLSKLTTESVFAALAENYNRELLIEYVGDSKLFDNAMLSADVSQQELADEAVSLYQKWLEGNATFRFETVYQQADSQDVADSGSGAPVRVVFPIRGLVAVYLFIIGIYSAVMNRNDWERGIFLPLTFSLRQVCSLACLAAPVFLAGASGLLALWCGGQLLAPGREVMVMFIYLLAICLFSWLMGRLLRSAQLLSSLIPFLVLGSLIFCPVFIDLGTYLPVLKPVSRLFLPYYYLLMFR